MIKIIIGTTPTFKYKFSIVDPPNFTEAIMTIKDSCKQEKLRKILEMATVTTEGIHAVRLTNVTLASILYRNTDTQKAHSEIGSRIYF